MRASKELAQREALQVRATNLRRTQLKSEEPNPKRTTNFEERALKSAINFFPIVAKLSN